MANFALPSVPALHEFLLSVLHLVQIKVRLRPRREKIAEKKLSNLKCIDINPHSSPGKVMMFVKPTSQHTLEIRIMLMKKTMIMMMNA